MYVCIKCNQALRSNIPSSKTIGNNSIYAYSIVVCVDETFTGHLTLNNGRRKVHYETIILSILSDLYMSYIS